jgi:hypothetical protein
MEVLKLLFMLFIYYIFSYFNFYTKILLFFSLSLLTSFLFNLFQNKNSKIVINLSDFYNFLSDNIIFKKLYELLKFIDDSYIEGRKLLFYNSLNFMAVNKFQNRLPYMINNSNNMMIENKVKSRSENKKDSKKNNKENNEVFKNNDEMISFLDNLEKKNN